MIECYHQYFANFRFRNAVEKDKRFLFFQGIIQPDLKYTVTTFRLPTISKSGIYRLNSTEKLPINLN